MPHDTTSGDAAGGRLPCRVTAQFGREPLAISASSFRCRRRSNRGAWPSSSRPCRSEGCSGRDRPRLSGSAYQRRPVDLAGREDEADAADVGLVGIGAQLQPRLSLRPQCMQARTDVPISAGRTARLGSQGSNLSLIVQSDLCCLYTTPQVREFGSKLTLSHGARGADTQGAAAFRRRRCPPARCY